MKNTPRARLNANGEERRGGLAGGAPSRHTEGSGLGLNIARSLMDLMGGSFQLSVDGDLFKAELLLKKAEEKPLKPLEKPIRLSLEKSSDLPESCSP